MKFNEIGENVYFIEEDANFLSINFEATDQDYDEVTFELKNVYWYDYTNKIKENLLDFLSKNNLFKGCEELWVGSAYQCSGIWVLEKEPKILKWTGSGFNYGSSNLIEVPSKGFVLVLAQDD